MKFAGWRMNRANVASSYLPASFNLSVKIDFSCKSPGIEKSVPLALPSRLLEVRYWSYAQRLATIDRNSCGQTRQTPKCKPVRSLYMPKRLTVEIDARPARRSQSPVEYHYGCSGGLVLSARARYR